MNKLRVQIVGPIASLDLAVSYANFEECENKLRAIGIDQIFNPRKSVDQNLEYEDQMAICLQELESRDMIVLLPNWEKSPGAKREFKRAHELRLQIRHLRKDDIADIKKHFVDKYEIVNE